MVRAVLLDADGVVQSTSPTWRTSLGALCGDPERTEEFLAEVFAAEGPCVTGEGDFREALAPVLRRWNSRATVGEALGVWTEIAPDYEMLGVVDELRAAGFVVALATNQQAHRADYMTRELGYEDRFDLLLYSCELGSRKPDPAYFESAMARLQVPADEALFVDDHEANVTSARHCGLRGELFHLSEGRSRMVALLGSHGIDIGAR